MDLHPDLMDVLGAFSSSNVEYLIVGGWAVSVHSEPRFTKDLDLLIGTAPDNLERAARALALLVRPTPSSTKPGPSVPTSSCSSAFLRRESLFFEPSLE